MVLKTHFIPWLLIQYKTVSDSDSLFVFLLLLFYCFVLCFCYYVQHFVSTEVAFKVLFRKICSELS